MPIYLKIFNLIFSIGLFPDTWSQGLILPIHKKGDKMNPDNYKGITLLSCFGKRFTFIINDRITKFVEDENILSNAQAGFRKGYSTTEQIFSLNCLIDSVLNSRKNYVVHLLIFTRPLTWYGEQAFEKNSLNMVYKVDASMLYRPVKSCIFVNGKLSPLFECNMGVRQGDRT